MRWLLHKLRSRRALALMGTVAVVTGGLLAALWTGASANVVTAEVQRTDFVDEIQLRGDISALKSRVLTAPSAAGDLQIVQLVKNGANVQSGETLVQFDTTRLERTLEQKRSELKAVEAEIEGARAQARIKDEEVTTELTSAEYGVERAKLDAGKQEILSEIESGKAKLRVSDAEKSLWEKQEKKAATTASTGADLKILLQKRAKARFDVQEAERQIASMTLRAPEGGMVTLLPNYRARNWFSGGSVPEFKQGDRAWPGAGVVELPDLSTVRLVARVDEADRGRLRVGLPVSIRVDAVPDREFAAEIVEISALAKVDFSSWPPPKNFDVVMQLKESDPRLRPGMTGSARVAVETIADSIVIPSEAVFQKEGRSLAYVVKGSRIEARTIQIAKRGRGRVQVASGLQPGERVALTDPEAKAEAKP